MKPVVILLGAISFLGFACKKDKEQSISEVTVTKSVEYRVFATKPYADPIYKGVIADLELQISKRNLLTGVREVLWDSVFATRTLNDFPPFSNMLILRKYYPIIESKEKLGASYAVKYNDNGFISQQGTFNDLEEGRSFLILETDL